MPALVKMASVLGPTPLTELIGAARFMGFSPFGDFAVVAGEEDVGDL